MSGIGLFQRRKAPVRLSPGDNYKRRQIRRRLRESAAKGSLSSMEQIFHPEHLLEVYVDLRRHAGQSPGIDKVSYDDLSPSEVGVCMRVLSEVVLQGVYTPAPSRLVQIPKISGKGVRKLGLRSILDRVVSATLNKVLTPFWDKVFLPGSFGFRPKRGPWDLLLQLEKMIQGNRYTLAIDDIKDCFDHVNRDKLMEDHRTHIKDEKLLTVVEDVLRGGKKDQKEGILQGDAYSPTAMNVSLHFMHDLRCCEHRSIIPVWLRYADNLIYPCQTVSEGIQVLQQAQSLLQPFFTLKGEEPPVNLKEGKEAQIMGFQVSLVDDHVRYGLGQGAWDGLKINLEHAHEAMIPAASARSALRGWISAYGAAFEGKWNAVERVLEIADSYGFSDLITRGDLYEEWQSSWDRWKKRRKMFFDADA